MSEKTETWQEVVASMRNYVTDPDATDLVSGRFIAGLLCGFAARFEAAQKTMVPAELAISTAAMRKALKDVLDHAAFATEHATMLTDGTPLLDRIRAAYLAPARNCDKLATNADEAIAALKQRFPVEEFFAGFAMAAKWLYDTQDYCLGEVADRPFGQPEKGGEA